MRIPPETGNVGIVLVGRFNPRIFHPIWFARNGLLSDQEADSADIEVIHSEIAIFRLDWLVIRVEPQRFIAETTEAPYVRLSDLVIRIFREFLPHTPINMLGINRRAHFSVGSEEVRNCIGKKLAPHEPWGEWSQNIEGETAETRGGLRSLTMQQRGLDDRDQGHINAKIEPSMALPGRVGIFMEINDHYELRGQEDVIGSDEIITMLQNRFEPSIRRSERIIDQIMALRDECTS
jgi:hypothetical protein